jgi:hypothetical protein
MSGAQGVAAEYVEVDDAHGGPARGECPGLGGACAEVGKGIAV